MNCTSHFIALRMREAGFPVDETEREKWLYNSHGAAVYTLTRTPREMIYAPTLADILPLIPDFSLKAVAAGAGYFCYQLDPAVYKWSANPHDAAALAWLSLHEKRETL